MGIRVDSESLDRQLRESGCDDRRALPFHKMLLEGKLPLTIGGGIGQSRLSMLLMNKAHRTGAVLRLGRRDARRVRKGRHRSL